MNPETVQTERKADSQTKQHNDHTCARIAGSRDCTAARLSVEHSTVGWGMRVQPPLNTKRRGEVCAYGPNPNPNPDPSAGREQGSVRHRYYNPSPNPGPDP